MFTLNNPTDAENIAFELLVRDPLVREAKKVRYIIYQTEQGEAEQTTHLQGYMEFTRQRSFLQVKRTINERMHIEIRRGTQAQAIAYCTKEDTRVEGSSGEGGMQANATKKQKLAPLVAKLQAGEDLMDIEDDFPCLMLLHRDKIQDFAIKCKGKRDWATEIEIFVGKTGTGKSFTAKTENEDAYNVPWPMGGRWWWPNYTGEHCVIMDEFRHQVKMDVMLKMLDRYAWTLESKGRNFQFVSRKIVITTNIDPKDWYSGVSKEVKEPLRRRIQEFATIYDFQEDCPYPDFVKVARTGRFEFNETVEDRILRFDFTRGKSSQ